MKSVKKVLNAPEQNHSQRGDREKCFATVLTHPIGPRSLQALSIVGAPSCVEKNEVDKDRSIIEDEWDVDKNLRGRKMFAQKRRG